MGGGISYQLTRHFLIVELFREIISSETFIFLGENIFSVGIGDTVM